MHPPNVAVVAKPSFTEVLEQYQALVSRTAAAFLCPLRPYPDKDDLLQEGTIALWQAYTQCTNWDTFPAFARCAVRHRLITLVRRERRKHPLRPAAYETELRTIGAALPDLDLQLIVRQVLRRLPREQATNLWAVHALGWPGAAWARSRCRRDSTVRQSLAKGRRRFREEWSHVSTYPCGNTLE